MQSRRSIRKIAIVFTLAVFVPSLILAWLAMRSLRDQQYVLERQQALLYQGTADNLAEKVRVYMGERQREFEQRVEQLLADQNPRQIAPLFDEKLRGAWDLADIGFAVTLDGSILSPAAWTSPDAARWRRDNELFLSNKITAEVYPSSKQELNSGQFAAIANRIEEKTSRASISSASSEPVLDAPVGASVPSPQLRTQDQLTAQVGEKQNVQDHPLTAPPSEDTPQPVPPKAKEIASSKMDSKHPVTQVAEESESSSVLQQVDKARDAGTLNRKKAEGNEMAAGGRVKTEPRIEPTVRGLGGDRGDSDSRELPAATEPSAPSAPATPISERKVFADSNMETDRPRQLKQSAESKDSSLFSKAGYSSAKNAVRTVIPQKSLNDEVVQLGKTTSSEAEFRQIIAGGNSGSLARFVDNKLRLMVWYRSPRDPQLIFGAQLNLDALKRQLPPLLSLDYNLESDVCAALIDDTGKPAVLPKPGFTTNWRHPFVASEIGELLPHWEVGVYLLNPDKLNQTAHTLKWTFSLLILGLVAAIAIGGWLVVTDLRRQELLTRQKTDFVSNVSHELKTPLTSIRMFAELLTEGRVDSREKQAGYLKIISAEAARLTRLINNVLDFAKLDRGEKKYRFESCSISDLVREVAQNYEPHLEANGIRLDLQILTPLPTIPCDRDALSQILVNLISNAEKYGGPTKEITMEARHHPNTHHLEIRVMDRGPGVPPGCEEKIFEQFYRGHDSLSSGIQGSGLGLTLARQIARAHGGDVIYSPREGGGSCFTLKLRAES